MNSGASKPRATAVPASRSALTASTRLSRSRPDVGSCDAESRHHPMFSSDPTSTAITLMSITPPTYALFRTPQPGSGPVRICTWQATVAPGLLPPGHRLTSAKPAVNRHDATDGNLICESLPFRQRCSWMLTEVHRCTNLGALTRSFVA